MIDRSPPSRAALLRTPDIRLSGVEAELIVAGRGFRRDLAAAGRSILVFVTDGSFEFAPPGDGAAARSAPPGTTVGVEDGRALAWRLVEPGAGGSGRLFVSSIARRVSVLQRLTGGVIVVPADAEPFAGTLRLAIDLHRAQLERDEDLRNDPVINRCAEICLIQLVGYARAGLSAAAHVPGAIAHDERLLAAWTAYFADPRRRWTVKALADAAALGRTAFAVRFRNAFGAPPLQALTALRLEQAEILLRDRSVPLIEIAFTVGYNSEAAFVRAFHRRYGITPGRFRTRHFAKRP